MVKVKMTLVKYLLFLFNLIFVIGGLFLVVVAIILQVKGVTVFGDSSYVSLPIILASLGCFVFVLAFLGCWGAIKENVILIALFAILMIALFICQVAVIILAVVNREKTEEFIKDSMKKSLSEQKNQSTWEEAGKRAVWAQMQTNLKCCGVEGPKDYKEDGLDMVESCCEEGTSECTEEAAFQTGCYESLKTFINNNIQLIGAVGGGIAVVEVIVVVFAIYYAKAIRDRNKARAPPPDSTYRRH